MIINTVASAQIHSRYDAEGKKLINMHIRPILGDGILSGIACDMTASQARQVAETLIRLADAADENNKDEFMADLDNYIKELSDEVEKPSITISGRFTAENEPLEVIVNGSKVVILPGMTADIGSTGPGAYDCIYYKGFEIIMYEDERLDPEGPYTGPFVVGPDMQEVANLEAAKKLIDEKTMPIPATETTPQNNAGEMTVTIAQLDTLYNRWQRIEVNKTPFMEFMRTVQPTFGCDGAVVVGWCGMWLVIEKDGYAHS